jgi:hypothetical protein
MKKQMFPIVVLMMLVLPFLFSFTTNHRAMHLKNSNLTAGKFKVHNLSDTIEVGDFQDMYSGIWYSVFADTTTNTVVYIGDTYGGFADVGHSFSIGAFYGNPIDGYYLSIAGYDDIHSVAYDYGDYLVGFA